MTGEAGAPDAAPAPASGEGGDGDRDGDSSDSTARHLAPGPPQRGTDGPTRAWTRWVLPVLLVLVGAGAGAAAVALDAKPSSSAIGGEPATTPVLSARRVPEVLAEPLQERRLAAHLQGWLASSPPDTCLVVENQGEILYAHNPSAPVTGASTQKLLTATGLLLALGPDATFDTQLVAAAPPQDGVVTGDLYVVGGGDAALGTTLWSVSSPGPRDELVHDVENLVDTLLEAGITRIDGAVVGDGSRYDAQRYNQFQAQRLVDQDQVGPIGGLMVNDGFAAFSEERSNASTVPATDPAADAARVITEILRARGIPVAGGPRAGLAPADASVVVTFPSPPVSQVVAEMLTHSDNETAEAAIKEIGLAASDEGSWAAGTAALTQLLSDAAVPLDGVAIIDGSGLSIEDRLTCATLVGLLSRSETGPVLRDGLAIAGQTGTLVERWRGTSVEGRLRGKSGSLRNVTALAGDVEPLAGGRLTFAYVANVPDPGTVTPDDVGMSALGDILVAYPQAIDLAPLEPT